MVLWKQINGGHAETIVSTPGGTKVYVLYKHQIEEYRQVPTNSRAHTNCQRINGGSMGEGYARESY